jgi:hypothetical protein
LKLKGTGLVLNSTGKVARVKSVGIRPETHKGIVEKIYNRIHEIYSNPVVRLFNFYLQARVREEGEEISGVAEKTM